MTAFLGTSPSQLLGHKQYFRVTFDVSGQGLLFGSGVAKLNHIYDHMQDTGALAPMSQNPVSSGDTVMVVDTITLPAGEGLSVAEAVRRLEMLSGGIYSNVRSIQKLQGIGDVAGGADQRDQVAADANQQNDATSFSHQVSDFFAGFGHYTTLVIIGVVAVAVISLSPTLSAIVGRRQSA